MRGFFVPSSFGKNTDTIKFKSIQGNLTGTVIPKNKLSKAKKKKPKKKAKKDETEPVKADVPSVSKVKQGRISKKNVKQQKLQMTPALAKAAENALAAKNSSKMETSSTPPTTALEMKFKEQLMGGRFRFLNEQLYTMNSRKAVALFREDPDAFTAYHDGYRHQVEKWPFNPLNRIIKMIRRLPKTHVIGDFGCGEAALAKSVPNKVYSMDLVSCRDDVIACDMSATPLEAQKLDVAVYCLSLMGTNLKDILLEANRVLKMGGQIYIAEIQSRFEDVREFVRFMAATGFELVKKDVSGVQLFYFFQFRKVRNVGKVAVIPAFSLKPCLYRKR